MVTQYWLNNPFCYLDFEYTNTKNEILDLVCASTIVVYPDGQRSLKNFWLWNQDREKRNLKNYLESLNCPLVAFAVSAEGRALYSLGIDPLRIRWVDLMVEWKQIRNQCHRWQYGWVQSSDGWRRSRPPREGEGDSSATSETGTSLSDAIKNLLSLEIDTAHKSQMRNRIIAGGPFREDEKRAIMAYCESDTDLLPELHIALVNAQSELLPTGAHPRLLDVHLRRGRFAADMARCEARGMPLHIPRIEALSRNHDSIAERIIEDANTVFPFWVKEKKGYVQKYDQFSTLIRSRGWDVFWPLTETQKFSTEEKVLDDFKGYPEIAALRSAKKTLGQIRWFRPEALPEFYARVGSDGRLRSYFNVFGTQTGRNAPPAKTFVLAMSAWLRCLISAYPGFAITGRDWSSQEFAIAAALSGDANMLEAYNSGDPYLDFAKRSGAVPQDATRVTHELERELFKASCLAEGSPVRVKGKGFIPIENVKRGDLVWDGETWRECDGAIFNGRRRVVSLNGILATPDHYFLTDEGWVTCEKIKVWEDWKIHPKNFRGFRRASANWADVWALASSILRCALSGKA